MSAISAFWPTNPNRGRRPPKRPRRGASTWKGPSSSGWNRSRWPKGPSWPWTSRPDPSGPWSAGLTSSAASSTGRSRRAGSQGRRSSRSPMERPSLPGGSLPLHSFWTSRLPGSIRSATSLTNPRTTTANTSAGSRCGRPSRVRATCRRCGWFTTSAPKASSRWRAGWGSAGNSSRCSRSPSARAASLSWRWFPRTARFPIRASGWSRSSSRESPTATGGNWSASIRRPRRSFPRILRTSSLTCSRGWWRAAPPQEHAGSAGRWPARPAPRTSSRMPGSSASTPRLPRLSGSATTETRRWENAKAAPG